MYSLHPVTPEDVRSFLTRLRDLDSSHDVLKTARLAMTWLEAGDSRGPDLLSYSLARYLALDRTSFAFVDMSFTNWEARIERGVGMMMRPPSRLFVDAGMARELASTFPIRLDTGKGSMAGAYVPAHLIDPLLDLYERRLVSQLVRLTDAGLDPVATMGHMLVTLQYARDQGVGLIEAMDVHDPNARDSGNIRQADRKALPKELRQRLELAAKPARKPGLFARLVRSGPSGGAMAAPPDPASGEDPHRHNGAQ